MRRTVLSLLFFLAVTGASAADPFHDFWYYELPKPPVSGDCEGIASAVGAHSTWYGEFGGSRVDPVTEHYGPYAARGCFRSAYACEAWKQQAITYLGAGGILYARCRPFNER